jgi:PRTRC genetic system protein A
MTITEKREIPFEKTNYAYLTDRRDQVVFSETPTLMQPRFGEKLPEPQAHKHRFVCGQDGLYIEAQNQVIGIRQCIAQSLVRLPYGKIEQTGIHLRHGQIPSWILADVIRKAANAVPNEWAGLIVWNEIQGQYQLFEPDVLTATSARISYSTFMPEGLIPVMDLHSHGNGRAFFSATDDQSDLSGFYVAVVMGKCASDHPEFVIRMVVNGHFLPYSDFRKFFQKNGDNCER